MLDVPADVPPVLVALTLVSTTLVGVAFAVSPTPAPRAVPLAGTVDAVAGGETQGVETRAIDAAAVRITPDELAVRGPGGTAHAAFAYGPVVPVRENTRLWRVLHGIPPEDAFDSPSAFEHATVAAGARQAHWRRGAERLTVRRITWGGVDVTLVGA